VTNVLRAGLDDAIQIGTLEKNRTQLDVSSLLSKANPTNYYAFSLDSNTMKLNLVNLTGTSGLRAQLLDSSGTVVADSSPTASLALRTACASLNSSTGLRMDPGDYYVKVTYDVAQYRSTPQAYELCLYSGHTFTRSYETVATPQLNSSQHVSVDNTMSFSTLGAEAYANNDVHRANETAETAVNIGWLYENKTALGATSMLTSVCDEEYYSFTLQKGESLKFTLDNQTGTADLRVQVLDPTGTYVYADSEGTTEQKAAYAKLTSPDGMAASQGNYVFKISYAAGEDKNADQTYHFKVFSGTVYEDYYETTVATETAATAILSGSLNNTYSQATTLASYLQGSMQGNEPTVMDYLQEI
jgi:hypothetical protein